MVETGRLRHASKGCWISDRCSSETCIGSLEYGPHPPSFSSTILDKVFRVDHARHTLTIPRFEPCGQGSTIVPPHLATVRVLL